MKHRVYFTCHVTTLTEEAYYIDFDSRKEVEDFCDMLVKDPEDLLFTYTDIILYDREHVDVTKVEAKHWYAKEMRTYDRL